MRTIRKIRRISNLSLAKCVATSLLTFIFCLMLTSTGLATTRIAILGDRTGGADTNVFNSVVDEMTMLHPDFVLTVGDLIEGPQPDREAIDREWDTVMDSLKPIKCPIYHVAGNNDIFGEESRKAFTERTGFQPEYSFDFSNIHITVLDNSEMRNWNTLSEERHEWLRNDLAGANGADYRIVVFHKPFWLESMQRGNQSPLHELFVKHNVDLVLSGHHHRYTAMEKDGVRYIMIGSSGGHTGKNHYRGEGYHYGWLVLDSGQADFGMMEVGRLKHWDWLTYDHRCAQDKIDAELLSLSRPVLLPDTRRCAVRAELSADCGVTSCRYRWKTEGTRWIVSSAAGKFQLDNGDYLQDFAALIGDDWYPLPELELELQLQERQYVTSQTLSPIIQASIGVVASASEPVVCDGILDEEIWSSQKIASLKQFCAGDGGAATTDPLEIRGIILGDRLYISAQATLSEPLPAPADPPVEHDGPVFMEDCVYLVFWTEEEPSKITQIVINAHGKILDQNGAIMERSPYYRPEMDASWNANLVFGNTVTDKSWCFEAGILLDEIGLSTNSTHILFNALRFQPVKNSMSVWQAPATFFPEDAGRLVIKE